MDKTQFAEDYVLRMAGEGSPKHDANVAMEVWDIIHGVNDDITYKETPISKDMGIDNWCRVVGCGQCPYLHNGCKITPMK